MRADSAMHPRRSPLAAFTLVELMISLTVGGIAITSIYAVGAASTRQFHQQQQIASAQSALRIAMNQVKRDISRAGYLSTPDANAPAGFAPQSCSLMTPPLHNPNVTGSVAAISNFNDDVITSAVTNNDAVDPTGANRQNGFTVDDIVLLANYETSSEYPGIERVNNSNDTVALPPIWHSFQRDFTTWYSGNPGVIDQAAFAEAFPLGRMVRIQTTRRLRHFALITAVNATPVAGAQPTVTFAPGVPPSCLGDVNQGWIAPLSFIRYMVQNAPAGENERADFPSSTGPVAQLIRREVDPGDKLTPFNGNPAASRAILDYVVGFNLAFTFNSPTAPGDPDNYTPGAFVGELNDNIAVGVGGSPLPTINVTPERARAVSIELAVRAPEQDPTLPWSVATCQNMRCFQVFPTAGADVRQGSARVRRLRADVFLPNVAYEGY